MKTTINTLLSVLLAALATFAAHDLRDIQRLVLPPAGGATYASGGNGGGYFVKSTNGSSWNLDVTDNGDGTGTYKKTDANGEVTDQGTMTFAHPFILFDSDWSDCEGFMLADEDDPGYFSWVNVCDGQVDGGLALKK